MLFSVSECSQAIDPFSNHRRQCATQTSTALLLGEFEQIMLFRIILDKPGIYLSEIQDELMRIFGIYVCVSTNFRTEE